MTVAGERRVDHDRVRRIAEREEAAYRARSPKSAALHARARAAMPLGVASSFQTYDPYPLFMTDGRGSRIWDADGNEYVDFDMAFGVLAAGHSHPLLAEALQRTRGERHLLHLPGGGGHPPGGGAEAALRRGSGALQQLGDRVDHGRHPRRPRFHGPREDPQVRRRLPRPSRRRAGQHPAAARGDGSRRGTQHRAGHRRACRSVAWSRR